MSMKYYSPAEIKHPKRFIKSMSILYDGKEDGFSLALINWEGLDHIGIRWNVAAKELEDEEKRNGNIICHGAPARNSIPSWFILPRELFNPALFDKDSQSFLDLVGSWPRD